jgi:hypothetical protein
MNDHPARARALHWVQALRNPHQVQAWDLAEWQRVVRLARRLRLLGRLAESLEAAELLTAVPAPVAPHLASELRFSRWRTNALVWTLERVAATLRDTGYPLVLLKGAAYIGQGLAIARGRLPSDVDILVPRAHIANAQQRLLQAGWNEPELDEHDRRYYHEWSHEVPPMRHPQHVMELDLHHNILPPVARTQVDAELLLKRLQPCLWPGWQVFSPVDQVLHSAAHLFLDSELRDRIRDLVDLDHLMRHFGRVPTFWDELPERAQALGLQEPLALACHFLVDFIDTPIPGSTLSRIAVAGPSAAKCAWLHPVLGSVLTPTEPDQMPRRSQHLSSLVLLARYHYGRMPIPLLISHLWHKSRAVPPATPVETARINPG